MKKLFAYGTLVNKEVLSSLLKCRFSMTTASLADYKRLAVSGAEYPAIRPTTGDIVKGVLIKDLSPEHFKHLDRYEGQYYQRISVFVLTDDNIEHQCETYVFKPEYYHLLTNKSWCNQQFRSMHMSTFINEL